METVQRRQTISKLSRIPGYAGGGKLKGPGTPTSDSIPARVVNTGEPIKVATGERIVSKKQDAYLQTIAKEKGFASVDAMLEAGTGVPVGPTLKYDNDNDERPGQKGPNDMDGDEPIQHADLGGLIDSAKRAVGMAPAETMIQKFARQDAERAAKTTAPAPAPAASAPTATPAPMGSQSVLDNRMKAAGLARGGSVVAGMAQQKMGKLPPAKKKPLISAPSRVAAPPKVKKQPKDDLANEATTENMDTTADAAGEEIQSYANGGIFNGGDPYAIPGYTPGMVQRSGIGLPGYNPLTQGQTMNMPTNGGDANADDMKKTEAKGFACGGAVKRMAAGGVVGQIMRSPYRQINAADDTTGDATRMGYAGGGEVLTPEQLAKQIPTGGAPGAGPTPSAGVAPTPGDGQMPYGEQMRNLGGALASVPVTAMKTLVSAPGYGFNAPSSPQPAPVAPATARPAATSPQAAPATSGAAPAPAAPATIPVGPNAAARLSGVDGVNVGGGITRFNTPGKSPLFTNMTDAAGMASNQALQNRGAITPENQAIAQGMSDRYGREAQNTNQRNANATQMASETAQAQRSTDEGLKLAEKVGYKMDSEIARKNAESTLTTRTTPAARSAAQDRLKSLNAGENAREAATNFDNRAQATDATTRRGQDITREGHQATERHLSAQDRMGQADYQLRATADGRAATKAALDNEASTRLLAAQKAMMDAKTPAERQVAEDNFRAAQGKYAKDLPPVRHLVVPGGQVTDETGQVRTLPSQVFNPDTGQYIPQPTAQTGIAKPTSQAEYDKLPKGGKYTKPDGSVHTKG